MDFNEAVEFFRKKYGTHSDAARALGWSPRKYRHLRLRATPEAMSDGARLLIALASKQSSDGHKA